MINPDHVIRKGSTFSGAKRFRALKNQLENK